MIVNKVSEAGERCFGCGACEQICSCCAIKMSADEEGFRSPVVDSNRCSRCGLCVMVCPALPDKRESCLNLTQRVYAARNKQPEKWMRSTSGAIFPIFAEYILAQGGVVYGCAWSSDCSEAVHVRIDRFDALRQLYQSKYVQSSTRDTYCHVQSDLNEKIKVLYSGTPCQIAGLKLFLQRDYPELLTIDLLCHGVPSPKMLSGYVSELERREGVPIVDLKFRDKKKTGFRSYVSYCRPDGSRRYWLAGLDPYLFGFYRELFNRNACYRCPFKQVSRAGDISLADYWGLELHHPELIEWGRYGASLCLLNTGKGLQLEGVLEKFAELVSSKLEYAAMGNPALRTPRDSHHRPELRQKIYLELQQCGFEWVSARYLRPKFVWIRRLIPARLKNLFLLLKRK